MLIFLHLERQVDLISLKPDDDKLHINELRFISTNLSNLISGVDKLDLIKLQAIPVDLKNPSDAVDNDVAKKHCKNTEAKIPSTSILTNKSQYDTDKQNLEKKIEDA